MTKKQIGGHQLKDERQAEKCCRKLAFIFLFKVINKLNTTINSFTHSQHQETSNIAFEVGPQQGGPHCSGYFLVVIYCLEKTDAKKSAQIVSLSI